MGFINQVGKLITDSRENIYNFTWSEEKISFTYHDKTLGDPDTTVIVEESMLEYDVTIDSKDIVYLICQKKDGSLLLLTYASNTWQPSVLAENLHYEILNLNISMVDDKIHIIYCSQSKENPNIYIIYHHHLQDNQWSTTEVKRVNRGDILNPISLLNYNDNLGLVHYDQVNKSDEIFIKLYDSRTDKWGEDIQLTSNGEYKLYIDSLMTEDSTIHLCYSQLSEGNLIIKYEKHILSQGGSKNIEEHIISNPANCSHPTLIFENSRLWIAWVEYDNLMSRFSEDLGSSWSTPYLWKETKTKDFVRYKFFTNNDYLKKIYNFSYSFGNLYPDIGFIGFGPLNEVVEAPLKTEKAYDSIKPQRIGSDILDFKDLDDEYSTSLYKEKVVVEEKKKEESPISKEADNLKEYIERLDKRLSILEEESKKNKEFAEKILDIEEKVDNIENYLRRRRGGIFGPR